MKKSIIEIDEVFQNDPRLEALTLVMGQPRRVAYGALVELWFLGFAFWKKNKSLIPKKLASHIYGLEHLLATDWIEERADGYYCRGAEKRWNWYHDRLEASSKGGKVSAERRKEKYGTAVPPNAKNDQRNESSSNQNKGTSNRSESEVNRSEPKPPSPSPSPSPSSTSSKTLLFDFHRTCELYELYPKKIGKKKGFAKLKTVLRKEEDFSNFKRAVENYISHLQRNKTEARFIKNFDTFVNSWEDWLDPVESKGFGVGEKRMRRWDPVSNKLVEV